MRTLLFIVITGLMLVWAACGGSVQQLDGSGTEIETDTGADLASVTGVLTEGGITERSTSAADEPVEDAEVWCEDGQTGEALGRDRTDADGQFDIEDLPAERALKLRFRYQAENEAGEIEGEAELTLEARERRQFNMQIRQHDENGDGECDAVSTEMNQLRLRFNGRSEAEEDSADDTN